MSYASSVKYGRDYALGKCIQSALRINTDITLKGITTVDYAYHSTRAVKNHITWHLYRKQLNAMKRSINNSLDIYYHVGMYIIEESINEFKK